jgi:hypothetical protein
VERDALTKTLQELEISHCLPVCGYDGTARDSQNRWLGFHCRCDGGPMREKLILGVGWDLGNDDCEERHFRLF